MPRQNLLLNATGDGAGDAVAVKSSQSEISVIGTFDGATVYFQDNKYDLGWADVLDASTGERLNITEATHEVELLAASNCGRSVRAVIASAGSSTDITSVIDEGI